MSVLSNPEQYSQELSLLEKIEIRGRREGGLIEAMVPVDLIDREEVPVDQGHVDEIAQSMLTSQEDGTLTGQLSASLVGEIKGKSKFSIIDGFHRDAALKQIGKDMVFCTIKTNVTEEDVADLRILTANSHSNVSFSRVYEWVTDSWDKSQWADLVTPYQAFALTTSKSTNVGRNLGLSPETVEEIQAWAHDKSEKWRIDAATIRNVMSTAQLAAPDLNRKVQPRKGGSYGLTNLTQQHLSVLVQAYPLGFEQQRAISDVILGENLTVQQTNKALEILKPAQTPEDVITLIENTDWKAVFPKVEGAPRVYTKKTPVLEPVSSQRIIAGRFESRSLRTGYVFSELTAAKLALENTILKGEYTAAPLYDLRQPQFTIDLPKTATFMKFSDLMLPISGQEDTDRLVNRMDDVDAQLKTMLISRAGLTEEQAIHALRATGQRLSKDIDEGILRHVEVKKTRTIDDLVRTTLEDEVRNIRRGHIASVTPLPIETSHHKFDSSLELISSLGEQARRAMTLVGFMDANVAAVSQIVPTGYLQAEQLTRVIGGGLAAADEKFAKEKK